MSKERELESHISSISQQRASHLLYVIALKSEHFLISRVSSSPIDGLRNLSGGCFRTRRLYIQGRMVFLMLIRYRNFPGHLFPMPGKARLRDGSHVP